MIKRTFNADDIEEKFVKYGFTIIRNFINKDEIEELRKVYEENRVKGDAKSFYVSHWIENGDSKKNIDLGLQKVLAPHAAKYLNNFIPVFAALSVKQPKPDSAMYLHQDWAHVDETQYRSLNFWVPLDGTDENNGAICLLKGSHRLFDYVRGVALPDTFRHIGSEKLQKYLTNIYLNPGDAVAWDHRVIHGSLTNISKNVRLAAVVNMRPAESEFLLFYTKPDGQCKEVEVYTPERDFFIAYDSINNPTDVEKTPMLRSYPYHDINVHEADLVNFLTSEFPGEFPQFETKKKESFFSKMFS
jgi:hypothetical protein